MVKKTEQPPKKRTRLPKLGTVKAETRLLQGRLSNRRPDPDIQRREIEAMEFLDHLRGENKTDREIITDGLLLMRAQSEAGYAPPSSVKLTRQMQEAVLMILEHVKMLQSVDLSSLRSQPSWNEEQFQKTSSRLHESAADFLGQSKEYRYVDEDD